MQGSSSSSHWSKYAQSPEEIPTVIQVTQEKKIQIAREMREIQQAILQEVARYQRLEPTGEAVSHEFAQRGDQLQHLNARHNATIHQYASLQHTWNQLHAIRSSPEYRADVRQFTQGAGARQGRDLAEALWKSVRKSALHELEETQWEMEGEYSLSEIMGSRTYEPLFEGKWAFSEKEPGGDSMPKTYTPVYILKEKKGVFEDSRLELIKKLPGRTFWVCGKWKDDGMQDRVEGVGILNEHQLIG